MTLSQTDLTHLLQTSSPAQIQGLISTLSFSQIQSSIIILQGYAEAKLVAAIQGLKDNSQIEATGKVLTPEQFRQILLSFTSKQITVDKLSPLLVGLSFRVFCTFLHQASISDLEPLKKEGLLEPLQHQLTLFVNECTQVLDNYQTEIIQLNQEIEELNHENLSYQELWAIENKIKHLAQRSNQTLEAISKALAITWNTNRIDLIEKLTHLKEAFHIQLLQGIGQMPSENNVASGLFAILEQSLSSVYGIASSENVEALQDEDLAIEGLTKLSIWYLKDYWELGLLPLIKRAQELDLDALQHDENERMQYRQQLFRSVQDQLNQLKIGTVGQLKQAQIFSKPMLKEYIKKQRKIN
jgi:hypothetical protein